MSQSINPVPYDQLPEATAIKSGDQLFVIQNGLFYRISRELITSEVGNASTLQGNTASAFATAAQGAKADSALQDASAFAPAEIELSDEAADATLVPVTRKKVPQWFQGIRNNLKAVFGWFDSSGNANAAQKIIGLIV